MTIKLDVLTSKKGSNHGGKCDLYLGDSFLFNGYVKYCATMSRGHTTSFCHTHQPIYEAITYSLGTSLGLIVPDYYVIDNRDSSLRVTSESGIEVNISEGMPFYFSSVIEHDNSELDNLDILENERIYRDLIGVDDIENKRHNYAVVNGFVSYHDLGCSFVRAHESRLDFPHGRRSGVLTGKDLKKEIKKISKFSINHNRNNKEIPLLDFVNSVYSLGLPVLGNNQFVSIDKLISLDEIEEVFQRIVSGIYHGKFLSKYKGCLKKQ